MREDHRSRRHGERRAHGLRRYVTQIHQHAEPVHFTHHLLAEGGQAVMDRRGTRLFQLADEGGHTEQKPERAF